LSDDLVFLRLIRPGPLEDHHPLLIWDFIWCG